MSVSVLPAQYFGERVDVGGRYLYMSRSGEAKAGTATVLLISGRGSDSRAWSLVQPILARIAKVCSYDRRRVSSTLRQPVSEFGDFFRLGRGGITSGLLIHTSEGKDRGLGAFRTKRSRCAW